MKRGPKRRPVVPRPDRVRGLEGTPFGWMPVLILHDGWLRVMTPQETTVYAFLCLVADRSGVSYYRRERIGRELGLVDGDVNRALARLQALDLVAYLPFRPGAVDGYRQVLALPSEGPPPLLRAHVLRAMEGIGDIQNRGPRP